MKREKFVFVQDVPQRLAELAGVDDRESLRLKSGSRSQKSIRSPWMHRPSLDRYRSLEGLEGDPSLELLPVTCLPCWTSARLLRVM